jgi:hypothetical protein
MRILRTGISEDSHFDACQEKARTHSPSYSRPLPPAVKLPRHEPGHYLPYNAEVKNAWRYTSIIYAFIT